MAYELGADGVYLIDHTSHVQTDRLVEAYSVLASTHPDKFIGLNFLQCTNSYSTFKLLGKLAADDEIPRLPDGLWVDCAAVVAEATDELRSAQPELRDIRYLGGIAFKYTPFHTEDPVEAAGQARRFSSYVDVVTTSGPGTGQPANPEKVVAMKAAIGPQRLAIASGIDASNIELYRHSLDEVLVSTSVETSPQSGIFDPGKLAELIASAHQEIPQT